VLILTSLRQAAHANSWLQFGIQVAIGTIAGGFSDTVAVWMLFRPRRRILWFQGAIPKNQARLAKSVGKTVGERLLTPHDLLEEIGRSGLRDALEDRLEIMIRQLLDEARGSLRDLLSPAAADEATEALAATAEAIADRIVAHTGTAEFVEQVRRTVVRARAELADRPLASLLTEERRAELAARTSAWAESFAASPDLERIVREQLATHAGAILASDTPLLDRVPPTIVRTVEGAIEAYLPLAVGRLGTVLHHPAARERIREALHDLFRRFIDDLQFHERLIARLLVTERTFDKLIDSLEHDGVEQLSSLLDDPTVRREISTSVHAAVVAFLRQPPAMIVGDGERAAALERVAGDYLLRVLRADGTRRFLVEATSRLLDTVQARTWGQLLAAVDDDTITEWVLRAATSARAETVVRNATRTAAGRLLDRPIGRLGRWVPADTVPRVARLLSPAIWSWIEAQIPALVERLHVQEMVERKILAFDQDRMEELIRGVIQRELKLIVRTGYVLGGLIAIVLFGLTRLVGL
jgi:uncharacterized membrane protein YheB (UPF0754 family)